MVSPVGHVEHDATARLGHVPVVDSVDLAVLLHERNDPLSNRLAAMHRTEDPLEIDHVLGEEVRPGVPVLADHPRVPEVPERRLDIFELEGSHYSAACRLSGQQ